MFEMVLRTARHSEPFGLWEQRSSDRLQPFFVPAGDIPPSVQIERPFKCKSFCADKGVIFICSKIILQEEKPAFVFLVQLICLFCVPEHIMVAPQEYLTAREPFNKRQILPAIRQFSAPGMIASEHECILRLHDLPDIFLDLSIVMSPHFPEFIH